MALRSHEWYNLNCTRPYPVDDQATRIDNRGKRLDHNLVADLRLLVPRSAGRFVHIGGLSVGPFLATITFVATENQFDTSNLVPVAAVTAPLPTKYIHYPVDALYPGVGGWVVWGTAIDQDQLITHRFNSGRQSLLLPRAATYYNELPVEAFGKLYGASLTGLIHLSGGTDIEIAKECRRIDDYPAENVSAQCDSEDAAKREVVVIRLKATQAEGIVSLPDDIHEQFAAEQNLLDRFSGPCGGRPESNTCGDPQPIETLNAVAPDCCGNLTLRFTGCAKLSEVTQEVVLDDQGDPVSTDTACGIVVDCGLDLTAACPDDTLPDIEGSRRWDEDVLCISESITVTPDPPDDTLLSLVPCTETLTFTEDFYDPIDADWKVTQGFWGSRLYQAGEVVGAVDPDRPFANVIGQSRQAWGTFAENCFAVRNNMVWEGDGNVIWRTASVHFTPVLDDLGATAHRVGLLFNHKVKTADPLVYEWWSYEVTQGYAYLIHFDGTAERLIYRWRSKLFDLNQIHALAICLRPTFYDEGLGDYTGVNFVGKFENVSGTIEAVTHGPVRIRDVAPYIGTFGITAKACHAVVGAFGLVGTCSCIYEE